MPNNSIADIVIAMAPEMAELKRLRAEVLTLRTERVTRGIKGYAIELSLADIINADKCPIQITMAEGCWNFKIDLSGEIYTGGCGYETDVLCLQAALAHIIDSYAELEIRLKEYED